MRHYPSLQSTWFTSFFFVRTHVHACKSSCHWFFHFVSISLHFLYDYHHLFPTFFILSFFIIFFDWILLFRTLTSTNLKMAARSPQVTWPASKTHKHTLHIATLTNTYTHAHITLYVHILHNFFQQSTYIRPLTKPNPWHANQKSRFKQYT